MTHCVAERYDCSFPRCSEMEGYRIFLGLKKEEEEAAKEEASRMKQRGDFTSPPDSIRDAVAINEAKSAGAPVDAFLSVNEVKEGSTASRYEIWCPCCLLFWR